MEITLCLISSSGTLTTYKTTIFKIKDYYKQAFDKKTTEVDALLTLAGNTILTVQFNFPFIETQKTETATSKKKHQRGSIINDTEDSVADRDFLSSLNKISTGLSAVESEKGICLRKHTSNIDSKSGNLLDESTKKNDSPNLLGSIGKPPLHRKSSASNLGLAEKDNIKLSNPADKLTYSEKKSTAFKVVGSPDRSLKRKLTLAESNPGSTSNSILGNLVNCQPANSVDFIELTYEDYNEFDVGNHLVEAVFISGLPRSDLKLITDSDKMEAMCKHSECSKLHSYRPEILAKFPAKGRSALQLTSIAASMCFTKGIKPCFTLNEKKIPIIEDYMNVMTIETGERFYQYNYHFYCKYECSQFNKNYSYFADLLSNLNITSDMLHLIQEVTLRDFVYLPFCICLVSKFPLTSQLNICLSNLVKLIFLKIETSSKNIWEIKSGNEDLITKFLKHVTYELPMPSKEELKSKKLKFYLPFNIKPIEISFETNSEIPQAAFNMSTLFDYFNIENLVIIFHLILHENKILVVGKSALILSKVLECIKLIIYPMTWINTYIPVLSEDLIKFLQCFLPFIMGIEETLMFMGKEHLDHHEGVYIVNLEKQTIETSGTKPKRVTKKTLK